MVLGVLLAILLILGVWIVDSPNRFIMCDTMEEALTILRKIRSVEDVEQEFLMLVDENNRAKLVAHPWKLF